MQSGGSGTVIACTAGCCSPLGTLQFTRPESSVSYAFHKYAALPALRHTSLRVKSQQFLAASRSSVKHVFHANNVVTAEYCTYRDWRLTMCVPHNRTNADADPSCISIGAVKRHVNTHMTNCYLMSTASLPGSVNTKPSSRFWQVWDETTLSKIPCQHEDPPQFPSQLVCKLQPQLNMTLRTPALESSNWPWVCLKRQEKLPSQPSRPTTTIWSYTLFALEQQCAAGTHVSISTAAPGHS